MEANVEFVFSAARKKIEALDGSRRDPGIRRRLLLRNLWRDWARPARSDRCNEPTPKSDSDGDSGKVDDVPAVQLGSTSTRKRSGDTDNGKCCAWVTFQVSVPSLSAFSGCECLTT